MVNISVTCPICTQAMAFAGHGNYFDRKSKYKTPISYCRPCDIYVRNIDNARLVDHLDAASYVQQQNALRFFRARKKFFDSILLIAKRYLRKRGKRDLQNVTLMDFGCAYGHLLDLAQTEGFKVAGIELNHGLLESCGKRGLNVCRRLNELSDKADVFTLIDSLYYVPDPRKLLSEIKNYLNANGFIVLRVTNRNLYAKLRKIFAPKRDLSVLGDSTISYSLNGLKRLFDHSGFRILQVIPECGFREGMDFKKKQFFRLASLITFLLGERFIVTPGLIVVAEPIKDN